MFCHHGKQFCIVCRARDLVDRDSNAVGLREFLATMFISSNNSCNHIHGLSFGVVSTQSHENCLGITGQVLRSEDSLACISQYDVSKDGGQILLVGFVGNSIDAAKRGVVRVQNVLKILSLGSSNKV